jgi:hypothetical protein
MHYFATTRSPNNIYNILVNSCKKDAEKKLDKSLTIFQMNLNKQIPSLRFIFYFLKIFLLGKIFFNKKFVNLKYRNCSIGRHSLSTAWRDKRSYLNFLTLFFYKIKYLIISGSIIDSAYLNIDKIEAVYVDHGVYLNGLIIQIFANNKKLIYQNVYPRGLHCQDCRKHNKKNILEFEDLLILRKNEKKLSLKEKKVAENKIKEITTKPEIIPWIKGVKFKKIKNIDFRNFTHIVYAHSFADGQLAWGTDGFLNVREWLEFTLEILDKGNNRVYVKAHPNFKIRGYFNEACAMDIHIFSLIKKRFENSKKLFFEHDPVKNLDLLKSLDKKTILISHHGSAILEGAYKNFKNISSKATIWEEKLKISNQWKTKKDYNAILKKSWHELEYANKDDLLKVCYLLYCNNYGHYGKKFWHNIISRNINVSRSKLDKNITKIIEKINDKKKIKLVKLLSQNIQQLNYI